MRTVTIDTGTDIDGLAEDAVRLLRSGEIVLIPTETQYGLCCNAEDDAAINRLIDVKGRDRSSPMALLIRDWHHAAILAKQIPEQVTNLVSQFWPGPLTVVALASKSNWPGVVSEDGRIGFRCSSHPLADRMAESSEFFIVQTSANRHGESPTADPDYLTNWLADAAALLIFDRSVTSGNLPSTVVDVSDGELRIVRQGAIDSAIIREVWEEEIDK